MNECCRDCVNYSVKTDAEGEDDVKIVEILSELADRLSPTVLEYHRIKAPEIKRRQYNSVFVMTAILVATVYLSLCDILDSTATFAVFVAVMWYIFGNDRPTSMIDSVFSTKK